MRVSKMDVCLDSFVQEDGKDWIMDEGIGNQLLIIFHRIHFKKYFFLLIYLDLLPLAEGRFEKKNGYGRYFLPW
jgi:predicted Co/Zn/Cd cation transporter (cation efflux family)